MELFYLILVAVGVAVIATIGVALIVAILKFGPSPRVVTATQSPRYRPAPSGPGVVYYRTKNGRKSYAFDIRDCGGAGYRVYILEEPDYGSRDSSAHATHRLQDEHGRYVCWTDRLETVAAAREVAALWADMTEDYILHGRTF